MFQQCQVPMPIPNTKYNISLLSALYIHRYITYYSVRIDAVLFALLKMRVWILSLQSSFFISAVYCVCTLYGMYVIWLIGIWDESNFCTTTIYILHRYLFIIRISWSINIKAHLPLHCMRDERERICHFWKLSLSRYTQETKSSSLVKNRLGKSGEMWRWMDGYYFNKSLSSWWNNKDGDERQQRDLIRDRKSWDLHFMETRFDSGTDTYVLPILVLN